MSKAKIYIICLLLVFATVSTVTPCGPYFDDAYLVRGTKKKFLSIPEGNFIYELEKIAGIKTGKAQKRGFYDDYSSLYIHTVNADVLDLKDALDKTNMPEDKRRDTLASYDYARTGLLKYLKDTEETAYSRNTKTNKAIKPFILADYKLAPEIPKEFVLYLEGAIAYHNNDLESAVHDDNLGVAIKKWEELLKLPEEQRYYKSVWATYMLGKAYLSLKKFREAIDYFEKTREYVSKGYKDSLDLNSDSYGWQALAESKSGNYVSSVHHYLKQEHLDVNSLSWLCRDIFKIDDADFEKVFQDDICRKVILGWVVSHPHGYWGWRNELDIKSMSLKLLNTVEKISEKCDIENADRIAWAYYNYGDFGNAKKWLALAKGDSPLAQWINAKLLMRDGKIDEAIAILQKLTTCFENNAEWNTFFIWRYDGYDLKGGKDGVKQIINSEIGVLKLRRMDYVSALDAFVKGAYSEDARYVAEYVLTTEELENYVKQHPKSNLEYLLAKRFARNSNWDKAIEYMPTSNGYRNFREKLESLRNYLNKAEDTKLSNIARANAYYDAALIMREYGMELVGAAFEPDYYPGEFTGYGNPIAHRFGINVIEEKRYREYEIEKYNKMHREYEKQQGFFAGTSDEKRRVLNSLPAPFKRYHYRYKAADLMWEAAQLLPDNDELKAKALCIGGSYIQNRDPIAADKFYKALVNTCRKTKLGEEADKLRWFPREYREKYR